MIAFLIGSLATWRLTSLLSSERGPFGIGTWLRSQFGVYHNDNGEPEFELNGEVKLNPITDEPETDDMLHEIAQGLTCIWCCSVWVAALIALLHPHRPLPGFRGWLLSALAMSASAIGYEHYRKR